MLKDSTTSLRVGDSAPSFALPTVDRNVVSLSDFSGKPVFIIFIRGTW